MGSPHSWKHGSNGGKLLQVASNKRVTVQSQLPALLGIKLAHQRVRDLALLGTFILRAVHSGSFPGSGQFTAWQGASFQVGLIFQPRQGAFCVHTLTLVILRVDISKFSDQDSASEMLSTIFCSKPGCSKPTADG